VTLRAAAVAGLFLLLAAPAATHASDDARARVVFELQDPRIHESSGLVDLGEVMVTVNDSGDTSRLFVLDAQTGETVGVTDFGTEVSDVEALAPAGRDRVWVGDIGDNRRTRDEIVVHRVRVAARELDVRPSASIRLRYPDRPHDAEALFADRRGRLHVITKSFGGGVVHRAPARLDPESVNVLEPVARLDAYVTDAALLRDGRHVLVRGPVRATVHELPGFASLGSFELPRQRQGEAVSVGPGDRVRVSSEGAGTPVHEVELPGRLRERMQGPATPSARPTPVDPDDAARQDGAGGGSRPAWLPWATAGVLAVVVVALGRAVTIRRGTR
jgi:hypothetical protein